MNYLLADIDLRFLDHEFMGEKIVNFLWCAGIILATLLLKRPVASVLARISSALTARYSYIEHKVAVRDILFRPMRRLVQVVLFYLAVNQLDAFMDNFKFHHSLGVAGKMNFTLADVVDHLFLFVFIVYLAQAVSRLIDFVYLIRIENAQKEKNHSRIQLLPLIKEMSKLVNWIIVTFWILGSVFHVNIPALITGLGIGGVAIALAGKETVENFFAAFTILSDKPFQTGDLIRLGDVEAFVERIGFRSTRLRNLDGSAYIIPNQKLVSQNLVNLSQRERRGMKVSVNVKYGMNYEALSSMSDVLKSELLLLPAVSEPVLITVEAFDKETFQLVVYYDLPHPLPTELNWLQVKRDVNMKIFSIVSKMAQLGTPVGTS